MIALDTNILVYALETGDDDPRHIAAFELLERIGTVGAVIPLPVIGELFNACRKKQLLKVEDLSRRVRLWLNIFDAAPATLEDYHSAAQLSSRHWVQYFDALIVTVAARAGANLLLSEDMQDGSVLAGLHVANPFEPANTPLIERELS